MIKHGFQSGGKQHPFYRTWANMIQRCTNPNNTNYHSYGARGIRVCERWLSFEHFHADMFSSWRYGLKLERRDNNVGYSIENCCWVTQKTQMRNRRNNRFITVEGETRCLQEWADRLGVSFVCIINRIKRGWSLERAVTEPSLRS